MKQFPIALVAAAMIFPGIAQGNTGAHYEDPEDASIPPVIDIRALDITNDIQNLYVTITLSDLSNPDPVSHATYRILYLFEWRYEGVVYSVRLDILGYESTHRGLGYASMVHVPGVPFVSGSLAVGPGSAVYGHRGSDRYFHNDGIEADLDLEAGTVTFTIPLVMSLTHTAGSGEDLVAVAAVGKTIEITRVLTATYGLVRTDTVAMGERYTLK
ncbi:MAG TPA: hypothetical protein VM889_10380 [Candidatus Thermoplasmatota archaeon]|nr:hypothetical protein [Candidatus Thermoplasmatota archaeon]